MASFVGNAGSTVGKAAFEAFLSYPESAWFFLGHRQPLTALLFGLGLSLACVVFTGLALVERSTMIKELASDKLIEEDDFDIEEANARLVQNSPRRLNPRRS